MTKLKDTAESARERAKQSAETIRTRAAETGATVRARASTAYEAGKSGATRGVEKTKQASARARQASEETIERTPIAVVTGGLALGALIGGLLPRTQGERKYLGEAGKRINEGVKHAAGAAREAGQDQLDQFGFNRDSVREQIGDLIDKAGEAAKSASKAAADTVKEDVKKATGK